ncbi:MAG: preprotein translocase subunit YajC [Pirellulaceae bacterium]|nr:preprotein translocase subunit YajC [Planctomycetales bacterium]MCA9220937.1 preprotein translocase subunit YajC [Planctomycetales bacterium]MCA9226846.1 preprotein translocase subunit YajC [Planctomycetales bacterium]
MLSPLAQISCSLFAQAKGAEPPGMFGLASPLIPFILIGVLFYFMIFRTERRRRAEVASMLDQLKKNDRVVTIGGIFGTVVNVSGSDEVTIRVDENSNTRLRVQRSAIARVITDDGGTTKDKDKDKD